jgi:hypothetical protein
MNENPVASVAAPAGWYPDPGGFGHRYWDGQSWTQNLSALAGPPPGSEARTGDWIGGVLLSLLMPLIGLIAGAVYTGKGGTKKQVGLMCVCLSAAMFFIWFVKLTSGPASGY